MRNLGRNLGLTTSAVAMAIFAVLTFGQQNVSDGGALLGQAIDQYKQCDLVGAKKTFESINAESLSDGDKVVLRGYMSSIDEDIKSQQAAMSSFDSAVEAVNANQISSAISGLQEAVACQLIPADKRTEAQTLLVVARQRLEEASSSPSESVDSYGNQIAGVAIPAPTLVVIGAPPADAAPAAPAEAPAQEAPAEESAATPTSAPVAAAEPAAPTSAPATADATPVAATTQVADESSDAQRIKSAMELVKLGRNELANGNTEEANKYANRALQICPGMPQAQELLDDARTQSTASSGESTLDQAVKTVRVKRKIADVEIEKCIVDANNEMLKGAADGGKTDNFDKAKSAVDNAESTLLNSKNLYSPADYAERQTKLKALKEQIAAKKAERDEADARAKAQMVAAEKTKMQRELEDARQGKVTQLLSRGKILYKEGKYQEAKGVYEEILKIDPQNPVAGVAVDQLDQNISAATEHEVVKDVERGEAQSYIQVREALIPWYMLLKYDSNWKQISARRDAMYAGTYSELDLEGDTAARRSAERKVKKEMQTVIRKINFKDLPLQDVIDYMREASGLNVYVDWQALEGAGIKRDAKVELNLIDVSFKTCLDKVLESVSSTTGVTSPARYYVQDNVITITTAAMQAHLEKFNRTYDIGDLIFRHEDFQGPRFDVAALTGDSEEAGSIIPPTTETTGTYNVQEEIDRIRNMINATLGPDASAEGASLEVFHGKLVVTQTSDNHAKILRLLRNLREIQAVQINIESRFIEVAEGTLNRIGVDLDMYFNVGSLVSTGLPGAPYSSIDGGWMSNAYPAGWTGQGGSSWMQNKMQPVPVASNTIPWGTNASTGFAGPTAAQQSLTTGFTFLDDIQVNFLLEATQAHQDLRNLMAPRLTLWNGQQAYVAVTLQRAYVSTFEVVASGNVAGYVPVIRYAPDGVMMDVRATASADRKYVTMTVRPQLTSVTLNTFTPLGAPGTASAMTITVPDVDIKEVCTTVSVPDSGTLLLGGQKRVQEEDREQGVPVVSKIPILGRPYTSRSHTRALRTLLILVRPKVVIQQEFEQDQFP